MLKTDWAIKNSIHQRRCCYKEHGKTHAKTEPRAEHAAIHVETVPGPHGGARATQSHKARSVLPNRRCESMDASKRVSSFVSLRSSNNFCNPEENRRCGQEHKPKPYGQKSERRQFFHGVNHFAKINHMFFLLSISEG